MKKFEKSVQKLTMEKSRICPDIDKNMQNIRAYQASSRGGTLYCQLDGDLVKLAGKAALYSVTEILGAQIEE